MVSMRVLGKYSYYDIFLKLDLINIHTSCSESKFATNNLIYYFGIERANKIKKYFEYIGYIATILLIFIFYVKYFK